MKLHFPNGQEIEWGGSAPKIVEQPVLTPPPLQEDDLTINSDWFVTLYYELVNVIGNDAYYKEKK